MEDKELTDVQVFLAMIAKSDNNFEKKKLDHGTYIDFTDRKIRVWFDKDGSFNYITTN